MPVALRDVTYVAGMQLFSTKAAMRTEHRHAKVAADDVLPFISVRVPMQLAQRAWLQIENYAGDRRRYWEAGGIDTPFPTASEYSVRRVGKHPKLVRLWWRNTRPCKFSGI